MKKISLALIFSLCLLSATTACAQTVYLSIAASMTDAFKELITTFSKAHPEAQLLPNFASSGSLAKQIDQGAPADFYVSANPKWMKYLLDKQLIAPQTDRIFAHNQLVFVSTNEKGISALGELTNLDRIAIGSPKSVPAGQYAKQAMENLGIYDQLEQAKKLVLAKDVRQALLYADRGEVDGSFVYKTDAMLARQAKILFIVPPDLHNKVAYLFGLTPSGADNDIAKAFSTFMATPEAIATLSKYGFEPVAVKQ